MRNLIRNILVCASIACFWFNTASASPVWKISSDNHSLYLAGTVHLLSDADYPLPAALHTAYNAADVTVFETDVMAMSAPAFVQRMLSSLSYTDTSTVYDKLSASTSSALDLHLSQRGIDKAAVARFKPGLVAAFLSVAEMQRLGLGGEGVDSYFSRLALQDGKQRVALETLEEQIAFIESMGQGEEDRFIQYTLNDIVNIAPLMNDLKLAWVNGDDDYLHNVFVKGLEQDFPTIYNTLLVGRNNAWMPSIEAMLQTDDVEAVFVGAAHLLGENGLISLLRAKGYVIEAL